MFCYSENDHDIQICQSFKTRILRKFSEEWSQREIRWIRNSLKSILASLFIVHKRIEHLLVTCGRLSLYNYCRVTPKRTCAIKALKKGHSCVATTMSLFWSRSFINLSYPLTFNLESKCFNKYIKHIRSLILDQRVYVEWSIVVPV